MAELLSDPEIAEKLPSLDGWQREGKEIARQFQFSDFAAAMKYVNAVAALAEEANHHPDIDIRWNKVLLRLSTHSNGGLTGKDFALADAINRL